MSFLNPIFLFALLTVAVPLLIYLLNLKKPKKVRFSTLAFFDTLKTTALKRIKIKRWLLLSIRILAIIALVLAASRPFLPPEFGWASSSEPKAIGILLDNSPTMERVDRNGPYFEQALQISNELLEFADNDDRIAINVTNGQTLNLPLISKRAAFRHLSDLETVNSGNYLEQRLAAMAERLQEASEPNKIIYLITDGQETQLADLQENSRELIRDVNLQIMKVGDSETSNTGYESVELEYGGRGEGRNLQLRTILRNYGNQTATNKFINLLIDGELISQQTFQLDPAATQEFLFDVPVSDERIIPVELFIEGDELTFDNRFFAPVQLPETRDILVLNESRSASSGFTSYLEPMLEIASDEMERFNITFEDAESFQVSGIYEFDAIILDGLRNIPDFLSQSLIDHVQAGAGLLFLPAAEGNVSSYNRLLNFSGSGSYSDIVGSYGSFDPIDRMAVPAEGHPILNSIFDKDEEEEIRLNVPEIFYYYELDARQSGTNFSILQTSTGNPLLLESRVGTGRIVYSAIGSDPGWSNFPIKPFFAPLYFRTIDYLVQGEGARLATHTLGSPFHFSLNVNTDTVLLRTDNEEILPEIRQTFGGTEISYSATEWEPGWLEIETEGQTLLIGVNQNAMESRLGSLEISEIETLAASLFESAGASQVGADFSEAFAELELASFGREIWYWFVLMAIILLLLESIISRHYKAETLG